MEDDKVYILNPDYHFRNDVDRIAMFSKSEVSNGGSANWIGFIHPAQAMLLAIFTDDKSFDVHCEEIASRFEMSKQSVKDMMMLYVNNDASFQTEYEGNMISFPKNVLIPLTSSHQLDMYDFHIEDFVCNNIDLTQDRLHAAPLSALFMVNNRCVTDCRYCYADKNKKCVEMSTQQILKFIDEAYRLRMVNIDVIGGELFCKKDWKLILASLVEKGLSPNFISTKIPMDEAMVAKLKQTGYNNTVQISLDSMDEDVLRHLIRCNEGYLKSLMHGIVLLVDSGFKITFDTVLTNVNCSEEGILKLYEYIRRLKGVQLWEIRVPEVSMYRYEDFKTVVYDRSALLEACDCVRRIQKVAQFPINVNDTALYANYRSVKPGKQCFAHGNCSILRDRLFILPDGKVGVCELLYWHPEYLVGDLTKNTLEEIWRSDRAKEVFNRRYGSTSDSGCHGCTMSEVCYQLKRRCPVKVVKAYGYDKYDYPDPECTRAPEFIRSEFLTC